MVNGNPSTRGLRNTRGSDMAQYVVAANSLCRALELLRIPRHRRYQGQQDYKLSAIANGWVFQVGYIGSNL